MEGEIANLGQFIGAGLAAIGSGIAAMGVGNVAANFLAGALRNPSAGLCRSSGDLLVPRRFAADVRGLIRNSNPVSGQRHPQGVPLIR
jgi:hypothetical protein